MNRLVLLAVLVCTFLTFTSAALQFIQVTDAAPWVPRQRANLVTLSKDIVVDADTSIAQGTLVLLGGDSTGQPTNDVWISNDGLNWQLVAGTTRDGENAPIYGTSSFGPRSASTANVDPITGRIYKACGGSSDIWYTDNVVQWQLAQTITNIGARSYPGVAVDTSGRLHIAGGYGGANNNVLADVWISDSDAKNFTMQVGYNATSQYLGFGAAPWSGNQNGLVGGTNKVGGRGSLDFESWKSPVANRDVLYLWTGSSDRQVAYNDVWVSGDSGASWLIVCKAAPWAARNDDTGGITPNGILVVAAGRPPADGNNNDQPDLNDVWASLDGGYTWGQCTSNAEFPDRRYLSSTFDANGYYFIMAGINSSNTPLNDVWKSSFSFFDVDAVASHCNLKVPACGVGLICFPGEAIFDANGAITCPLTDSCGSSGASSNSGAVAALAVLFVISTLIAAYALYYIWKSKKSQHSGHISSNETLGSLSDGNSLYKPLTIHS